MLAINTETNSVIICNGYKDEDYIELALLAQKMGKRIFIVVEKLNELRLIAKIAKRLQMTKYWHSSNLQVVVVVNGKTQVETAPSLVLLQRTA